MLYKNIGVFPASKIANLHQPWREVFRGRGSNACEAPPRWVKMGLERCLGFEDLQGGLCAQAARYI